MLCKANLLLCLQDIKMKLKGEKQFQQKKPSSEFYELFLVMK